MPCITPIRLAVALDGAGWHPAAWRAADAEPAQIFTAGYWVGLVQEAERGQLDFVTFEDSLTQQSAAAQSGRLDRPDERTDQIRGRLDAVLTAARVAPLTSRIGLIPTVTTTHTEPFHVSKSIATLDYVSSGRGGWRPQVGRPGEVSLFGRRELAWPTPAQLRDGRDDPAVQQMLTDLFDEATDVVEVVRRLWDSWQDDAIIRDAATGRFIDRDRLHYIDFEGRWFSVKGPSITPRPPQGQPIVAALAHQTIPYRFAARAADVVFTTPFNEDDVRRIVAEVRSEQADAGRGDADVRIFADLVVFLDQTEADARARKARLDELAGAEFSSDAAIFIGTPAQLVSRLQAWQRAGIEGFRLRPGALPHDLRAITRGLVTTLQDHDAFRRGYEAKTLRALLGLPRPANRYARST